MSNESAASRPQEPQDEAVDHSIELTLRYTVPKAFAPEDVDNLAALLVEYLAGVGQALYDDYGPDASDGYDGAYISAAAARCRVDGLPTAFGHQAAWGHSDRCRCHHPRIDHQAPEGPEDPGGRCFISNCDCRVYERLQAEV